MQIDSQGPRPQSVMPRRFLLPRSPPRQQRARRPKHSALLAFSTRLVTSRGDLGPALDLPASQSLICKWEPRSSFFTHSQDGREDPQENGFGRLWQDKLSLSQDRPASPSLGDGAWASALGGVLGRALGWPLEDAVAGTTRTPENLRYLSLPGSSLVED